MLRLLVLAALAAALVLLLRGDAAETPQPRPERARPAPTSEPERRALRRARCPQELANCTAVTGRVIAVEAVDPDGDGDAHYVLAGGSVTAPGISVIDVRPGLRPRRLPRLGDQVSAAGPVYEGSYGQKQIEAIEVHHRRR
jgi:hypothetical protein